MAFHFPTARLSLVQRIKIIIAPIPIEGIAIIKEINFIIVKGRVNATKLASIFGN